MLLRAVWQIVSGIRNRLLERIEHEDRGTRIHRNVRNYFASRYRVAFRRTRMFSNTAVGT